MDEQTIETLAAFANWLQDAYNIELSDDMILQFMDERGE